MLNRLLSFIHMIRFIYFRLNPVKGSAFLVSVAFFFLSIASAYFDPNAILFFSIVSIISILFAMGQIIYELVKSDNIKISSHKDFKEKIKLIEPSDAEKSDGFRIFSNPFINNSDIIYSSKFNTLISDGSKDFIIKIDQNGYRSLLGFLRTRKDLFTSVLQWKCLDAIANGFNFTNEEKVSVFSPIRSDMPHIKIFKGDYFSSFLTNELAAKRITEKNNGKRHVRFDSSSMFPVNYSGGTMKMREFGEYTFGNHIGISTIALSADKYLSFWFQNEKAQHAVNLRVPTGSGSLDWQDLNGTTSLKRAIIQGTNRELYEESIKNGVHVGNNWIKETLPIGYFRRVYRGGKPEFVSISKLRISHTDLYANDSEVEDRTGVQEQCFFPVKSFSELEMTINDLLSDRKASLSVSLWVNLLALRDLMVAKPFLVKNFFDIR